jgi:hypothetical protein
MAHGAPLDFVLSKYSDVLECFNVDLEPSDTFHISTTPFQTPGIIRGILEPIQAFQTLSEQPLSLIYASYSSSKYANPLSG